MRSQATSRRLFVAGFLAPATLIYAVFVIWPFLQTFWLSLFRFRGVSSQKTFVGTQYFRAIWSDPDFWQSLRNVGFLLLVGGTIVLSVSLLLAHVLQANHRPARLLRGVILFPQIVSVVAVAILWRFIYLPQGGLLTGFVNPPAEGWLGSTKTALPAVTVAWIWFALGFYVMLFAAGLRGIPKEVNEAAELDGVAGWKRFWTVSWPLLWSVKRVGVVYVVINVMNVFGLVYVMTEGGPARRTETLLTYLYEQTIRNSKFGYASAIATVNFALIAVLTLVIFWMFRRDPQQGAKA